MLALPQPLQEFLLSYWPPLVMLIYSMDFYFAHQWDNSFLIRLGPSVDLVFKFSLSVCLICVCCLHLCGWNFFLLCLKQVVFSCLGRCMRMKLLYWRALMLAEKKSQKKHKSKHSKDDRHSVSSLTLNWWLRLPVSMVAFICYVKTFDFTFRIHVRDLILSYSHGCWNFSLDL